MNRILAARHVRSAIPHFRAGARGQCRSDLPLGSVPVPNHALPTIRKPLLGEPVEECLDLGFERGHEHPACTFPGNLGRGSSTASVGSVPARFSQALEHPLTSSKLGPKSGVAVVGLSTSAQGSLDV